MKQVFYLGFPMGQAEQQRQIVSVLQKNCRTPAPVVVVIKKCWDVKSGIRNRLGRSSGQMVVSGF